MCNRVSFYLWLVLFMVFFTKVNGQGVSMSPTRLFLTGSPGEVVNSTVILYNGSGEDFFFNVNLKDWDRDIKGEKVYYDPNTKESSNASWISTEESTINLPPHSSLEINVKMEIPVDASQTEVTNSMLFFTQIGKAEDAQIQNGIGIITLFEFGLHVYYTPEANKTRSLDITAIELEDDSDNQNLRVEIENDGNIVNDAKVELELTEIATGKEEEVLSIPISMMPGALQQVRFNLDNGLKGEYLAIVIVRMAGTNDLRIGEKKLNFK